MTDPDPPVVVHLVHRYSPVYYIAGHPMIDHEGTLAFATADLANVYAETHDPVLNSDPVEVRGAIRWTAEELSDISEGMKGIARMWAGVDPRMEARCFVLAAKAADAAFLEVTRDA